MKCIHFQYIKEGRRCTAMDITYDPTWMDINSERGFTLAMYSLLTTKRGGGCTFAPVCSSWVYVPLDIAQ